jgi:hypothetical protein
MTAIGLVELLTQIVFGLIFVLTLSRAVRRPERRRWEIAGFFGALAGIALPGILQPIGLGEPARLVGASLLLAQPYLLLRMLTHFRTLPPVQHTLGIVYLVAAWGIVVSTLVAPPNTGLTVGLVMGFAYIETYGSVAFLRSGLRHVGAPRWRLLSAAAGSAFLALAIVAAGVSALDPALAGFQRVFSNLLALLSALAYYVSFVPPRWLWGSWQSQQAFGVMEQLAGTSPEAHFQEAIALAGAATKQALGAKVALVALGEPGSLRSRCTRTRRMRQRSRPLGSRIW